MDRSVNTGGHPLLHGFSPLGERRGHPERSAPPPLTRRDKQGSRRKLAIRTNDYNRRLPRLSIGQSRLVPAKTLAARPQLLPTSIANPMPWKKFRRRIHIGASAVVLPCQRPVNFARLPTWQ